MQEALAKSLAPSIRKVDNPDAGEKVGAWRSCHQARSVRSITEFRPAETSIVEEKHIEIAVITQHISKMKLSK